MSQLLIRFKSLGMEHTEHGSASSILLSMRHCPDRLMDMTANYTIVVQSGPAQSILGHIFSAEAPIRSRSPVRGRIHWSIFSVRITSYSHLSHHFTRFQILCW